MTPIENLAFTIQNHGEPEVWLAEVFDATAEVLDSAGQASAAHTLRWGCSADTMLDYAFAFGHEEAEADAQAKIEEANTEHEKKIKALKDKLTAAEAQADNLHNALVRLARGLHTAEDSVEVLVCLCDWVSETRNDGPYVPEMDGVIERIENMEE